MEKILQRVLRVIKLDKAVFSEIEHDESATVEALIIVVVTGFLSAIGKGISSDTGFFGAFIGSFLSSILISWILWSLITLWIGTSVFGGEAELGEMLRVIGYATAPRLLGFFSFIPCVGWIVALAGAILSLIAAFLAIREGLDLDDVKAIATAIIGWVIASVIQLVITALFAGVALTVGTIFRMLTGQ